MYCQKCNRLLKNENLICEKCGFDNNNVIKKTLKETVIKEKKKPTKFLFLILFLCLITIGLLITLIVYTNNNKNEITYDDEVSTQDFTYENKFTYKDLEIYYPDDWGSSTGTVFYKDYAKINITFRDITETEYNELLDVNDTLDYDFSTIKAKTYATDYSYSYTFNLNSTYYLITVNYTSDNSIFTKTVQNEISNMFTTLKEK